MVYKKIKNYVHKTATDWKNLIIGTNNIIGPYVIIGGNAQHPRKNNGKIYIGNNNVLMSLLIFTDLLIKKQY